MAADQGNIHIENLEFRSLWASRINDFPIDFENLARGIRDLYPTLNFEIVNDTWVEFKSSTDADYGGVVISGTGANFAARSS